MHRTEDESDHLELINLEFSLPGFDCVFTAHYIQPALLKCLKFVDILTDKMHTSRQPRRTFCRFILGG